MAVLTWRNVDAPNFGGAIDGVRTASMLLNNATETARQGIRDFTKSREDAGDRALLDYVQGIQDPTAMTEALANDPRLRELRQRASVDAIRKLDARPGDLIARSLQQENLTQESFNNNRFRTGVESMDANGETINRAVLAAQQGKFTAANSALSGLGSLRPDVLARILGTTNEVGSAGLQNQKDAWQHDNNQRNDTEARQAQALAMAIAPNAPTSSDAAALLQGSGATPAVQALALRGLQGLGYSGMFAPWAGGSGAPTGPGAIPGGTAAPASGSGSGGFAAAIPYAETRNYVANISSRVGNVTGTNEEKATAIWGALEKQESGGRQFNADGTVLRSSAGAGGVSQLMPATARELERKLGMEVGETDRDPAANRRAGQAYLKQMLDKYDGNVDYALAAYNAGPGTVDRWLKEGVGQQDPATALLQNAQSRVDTNTRAAEASINIGERLGQNRANSLAASLEDAAGKSKMSPDEAVQNMIQAGTFSKSDRGTLLRAVRYMEQRGVSPAIAAEIIRRNVDEEDSWVGSQFRRMFTNDTIGLSGGVRIDDDAAISMMNEYLTGSSSGQAREDRALEADQGLINQMRANYNAAEAQYQSFLNAARSNPGYAPYVERYRQARDAAKAALDQAAGNQENNPIMRPQWQQTQAQPAPVAVTAAGQPVQSDRGQVSVELPGGAFIWQRPPGSQNR